MSLLCLSELVENRSYLVHRDTPAYQNTEEVPVSIDNLLDLMKLIQTN